MFGRVCQDMWAGTAARTREIAEGTLARTQEITRDTVVATQEILDDAVAASQDSLKGPIAAVQGSYNGTVAAIGESYAGTIANMEERYESTWAGATETLIEVDRFAEEKTTVVGNFALVVVHEVKNKTLIVGAGGHNACIDAATLFPDLLQRFGTLSPNHIREFGTRENIERLLFVVVNGTKKLYHGTCQHAADLIIASQSFRPSPSGEVGSGVYFCDDPNLCERKAPKTPERILVCDVYIGKVRRVHAGDSITVIKFGGQQQWEDILMEDSIITGGTEYCIDRSNLQNITNISFYQ